ncbi:hypothetical protein HDZ31DRAFT_29453 [Schizophyllum fasciatum]
MPLSPSPSRYSDHISIYSIDADGSDDSEADALAEDDIGEWEEFPFARSVHNSPNGRALPPMSSGSTQYTPSRILSSVESTLVGVDLHSVSDKLAHTPPKDQTALEGNDVEIDHIPPTIPPTAAEMPPVLNLFTPTPSGSISPLSSISSSTSPARPNAAPPSPFSSPHTVVVHRTPRIPLPSKRKRAGSPVERQARKRARMCLDYVEVPPFPAGVSRDDYLPFTSPHASQRSKPTPETIEISSSGSLSCFTTRASSPAAGTSLVEDSADSLIHLITGARKSANKRRSENHSHRPSLAPSSRRTFDNLADAYNHLDESDSSSEEERVVRIARRTYPTASSSAKHAKDKTKRPLKKRRAEFDPMYTPSASGSRSKRRRDSECALRRSTPRHASTASSSVVLLEEVEPPPGLTERQLSKRPARVTRPPPPPNADSLKPDPVVAPITSTFPLSRASLLLNCRFLPAGAAQRSRHAQVLHRVWEEGPYTLTLDYPRISLPSEDAVRPAGEDVGRETIPLDDELVMAAAALGTVDEESSATSCTDPQSVTPPFLPFVTEVRPDNDPPVATDKPSPPPPPIPEKDQATYLVSELPTCATPAQLQDLGSRLAVAPAADASAADFLDSAAHAASYSARPSSRCSSAAEELMPVDPREFFNTDFMSVTDEHLSASGAHGRSTRASSPAGPPSYKNLHIPFGGTEEGPSYALADDLHGRLDSWMHSANLATELSAQELQESPASAGAEPPVAPEVTAAPFAPTPMTVARADSPAYSIVSSRPSSPASSRAGLPRERSPSVPLARKRKRAGLHGPPEMAGPDAVVNYKSYRYPMKAGAPHTRLCHQCRQKNSTSRQAMVCACSKQFCSRCIILRYYGVIEFDEKADFTCPVCEGYCSCDNCCRDRGDVYVSLMEFMKRRPWDDASPARASPRARMDATIEMNRQGGPSRSCSPARRRPTRRPFVVHRRSGPVTFWGTMYDLEGRLMGDAYEREVADGDPGSVFVSRPAAPREAAHARRAAGRRFFVGAVQESWGRIDRRKVAFVEEQGGARGRGSSAGTREFIGNRANLMRPVVPAEEEEEEGAGDAPITSIQWTRDSSLPPPAWESEDIGIRDEHVVSANALQNLLNFELGGGDWEPYFTTPA